jgi:hypothetical protein
MLLRKSVHRLLTGGGTRPDAVPETPPAQRQSPLELITEHLHDLGLGQQVHVRYDETGRDFVLEDADGSVHAKDYDKAVVIIERIWLYQPEL